MRNLPGGVSHRFERLHLVNFVRSFFNCVTQYAASVALAAHKNHARCIAIARDIGNRLHIYVHLWAVNGRQSFPRCHGQPRFLPELNIVSDSREASNHVSLQRPHQSQSHTEQVPAPCWQDVPQGGFGSRLNAMHDWQDERGIEAVRGQSRRENGRYHSVVLCWFGNGDAISKRIWTGNGRRNEFRKTELRNCRLHSSPFPQLAVRMIKGLPFSPRMVAPLICESTGRLSGDCLEAAFHPTMPLPSNPPARVWVASSKTLEPRADWTTLAALAFCLHPTFVEEQRSWIGRCGGGPLIASRQIFQFSAEGWASLISRSSAKVLS